MSKALESIYCSLENLHTYFSSSKVSKVEKKVLSMVMCDLINLEEKIKLFTDYKPPKRK